MSWYSLLTLAQVDAKPESVVAPPAGGETGGEGTEAITVSPGGETALPTREQQAPPFPWWMIVFFILFMWFVVFMPQRREKKKHASMLEKLKKGDRVQTIGGVLGTVVEVKDREVVVKVDESNNTRIRFTRAAIQGVLEESKD